MTEKPPRKRFSLVPHARIKTQIRDKDNAQPTPKPPRNAEPAPHLAPMGSVGIRIKPGHVLARQEPEPPKRRFTLDRNGDMTREFKAASRTSDKDRGHER